MPTIYQSIQMHVCSALQSIYSKEISSNTVIVNDNKTEHAGDYSVVTFALSKIIGAAPAAIAAQLGEALIASHAAYYSSYYVVNGFLNLSIHDAVYVQSIEKSNAPVASGKKIMIEFSSPNTNKPLHFGHLRNNFLGDSVSKILTACGHTVIKSNLLNDRGIHICKSMYAWLHFANGETPESANVKGDFLVGKYYVLFENKMKAQADILMQEIQNNNWENIPTSAHQVLQALYATWQANLDTDKGNDVKKKLLEGIKPHTPLMQGARELLVKWEQKDEATWELWRTMNSWVIAGFDNTYKQLGISFDKFYYESNTYLLGKAIVEKAVENKVAFRKNDNSIWIDLAAEGLDEKLLLRGDGTSVYITQDIGTAQLKYNDYNGLDQSIYVIADEQNYHMQVLKIALQKIKEPCAKGIHHLSYGMVELPTGRMKTREGTVVDADDVIAEMIAVAEQHTNELGKVDGFSAEELQQLYKTLGIGAVKFFLLRVDPKKRMIFNPQESIDFHGFTAPFIQYSYARASAILRKATAPATIDSNQPLDNAEKALIKLLEQQTTALHQAGADLDPSVICNYAYSVAKQFNSFLATTKVLLAESEAKKQLRLYICNCVKNCIAFNLQLLGIDAPEKM